ncbi:Uma2 family endonuclease [Aliterella atlantica]|uniref:Uma2 family endonuclease n=1 Tax=Aliterella atlantica TaxID=1827278 RepID=UPI0009E51BFA|nr:Uma2 family endonuclease [Aliterella atlantica]
MQLAIKHLTSPDVLLTVPLGKSILLENVSWQEFDNLLVELGNTRGARVAYDRGLLEIIVPLPEHEYFKGAIADLVQDLAEVLELDYETLGSTTWKRQDLLAGVEPDNCFYFQNEQLISGKLDFDLRRDPPPDLVLEIDVTSKSLNRFPIYARLGVPEIWRYDNGNLEIYQLQDNTYVETNVSLAFPQFPVQQILPFIAEHRTMGKRKMRLAFRDWVREKAKGSKS